jgi:hypothetical protein
MSCEQVPRAIESANLDRSTVDVRSRELLALVFPFVWQRVFDLFWVAPYLFWLARLDVLRGRNGCLGLLEGDCGSPFRGMDSAESSELSFLRFAQRRLIRPPRASLISPSDKRHDGKHNRNGQGNHSRLVSRCRAMEHRNIGHVHSRDKRLSALTRVYLRSDQMAGCNDTVASASLDPHHDLKKVR